MTKRKWFYSAAVTLLVTLVIVKAEIIRQRDIAEVPSIASEWAKHGKPVDAETITTGTLDFTVTLTGTLVNPTHLVGEVPVEIAAQLKAGQPFCSYPDGAICGTVTSVSPHADLPTGLHTIDIRLLKPAEAPRGRIVQGRVTVETLNNRLRIPRAAVITRTSPPTCWLIRNSRVTPVPLRLGRSNDLFYEVLAGVTPGDRVAIRGLHTLEANDYVRIHALGESP